MQRENLPILLANYLPKINTKNPAMLRRLIVVPFNMTSKEEADMDYGHRHHTLKDNELEDKLGTTECQQPSLTWHAKGAVAWPSDNLCCQTRRTWLCNLMWLTKITCETFWISLVSFDNLSSWQHVSMTHSKSCSLFQQLVKIMQNKGFIKLLSRNQASQLQEWRDKVSA